MSKILVIAGMHRSGTSLTASWLQSTGLFIGDNLYSGHFDNIKGHFEDNEILKIHSNDLIRKGLDYSGLFLKKEKSFHLDHISINQLNNLINKRQNISEWGWKEPRGTLYLNSWKKLVPQIKCLGVYRHYNSVISSLITREKKYYEIHANKESNKSKVLTKSYFLIESFRRKTFLNAWIKYNKILINYYKENPKDCIIIELESILKESNFVN